MNTELSAFYFDIRKDALYCEPYSSAEAPGGADDDREIFRRTSRGWRRSCRSPPRRRGSRASRAAKARCTSKPSPSSTKAWRNEELAKKWEKISDVRRVVTGALELERAAKTHRL